MPIEQQRELALLAERVAKTKKIEKARISFMDYVRYMWPGFIEGRHHRIMAKAFDRIVEGDLKRLIITLAPRHTKSEFASKYLPSFYMGHYPERLIIQTSHNADLAQDFGRDTRNLVNSDRYRELFRETELQQDTKAAGRWNTTKGGKYFAIGIGGKIAGKGADLLIIDDPHSEQDFIRSLGGDATPFDDAYIWYQGGPRQRLQPNAAIVIVMTRWHVRDLVGRLVKQMTSNPKSDQWEIIEFPALMPDTDNVLWPEFWSHDELARTREDLSPQQWAAQYLQEPTSEGAALVKREWWKIWQEDKPPECEFVIQAWDTAYTQKAISDYSACTTWGVFYRESETDGYRRPQIILLDAIRERLEFPELKRLAMKKWKDRQPDAFIIEAKASGLPVIFELRRMGIPVVDFTPARGSRAHPNDKISRVNGISDLFRSGIVWRPETRWAEEVAEEFAAFPAGEHDDYVDSGTMALMRFREGGFISLESDEKHDDNFPRKKADYY